MQISKNESLFFDGKPGIEIKAFGFKLGKIDQCIYLGFTEAWNLYIGSIATRKRAAVYALDDYKPPLIRMGDLGVFFRAYRSIDD